MFWLPYSSHTSHHPSQTPCLLWISNATQKTDARLLQDGRKEIWRIPYVFVAFFPSLKHNFFAYRSSKLSSCPDCIFEFTSCNKQVLSGCIPIPAVGVPLNPKSLKLVCHLIRCITITYWIFTSTNILNGCTKSLETYWRRHVLTWEVFCWSLIVYSAKFVIFITISLSMFLIISCLVSCLRLLWFPFLLLL